VLAQNNAAAAALVVVIVLVLVLVLVLLVSTSRREKRRVTQTTNELDEKIKALVSFSSLFLFFFPLFVCLLFDRKILFTLFSL